MINFIHNGWKQSYLKRIQVLKTISLTQIVQETQVYNKDYVLKPIFSVKIKFSSDFADNSPGNYRDAPIFNEEVWQQSDAPTHYNNPKL